MISFINLAVLFAAKVADNALSTTKTILVQRSRWILAGIAVVISDLLYQRENVKGQNLCECDYVR